MELGTRGKRLKHWAHRLNFEPLTADPASTEEGDAWLRSDIAPETDQIATLKFDDGSIVREIPIFTTGTAQTGVHEVYRVQVGGQTGYIPLAAPGDAAFDFLRFQHGGQTLAYHNDVEPGAIPDSGMFQNPVYQWWAGGYTGNDGDTGFALPEVLTGLNAAPAVSDPTFRANQSGFAAAEYDGTDDWHDASGTLDSQLPTGSDAVSIAALIYVNSASNSDVVVDYGASNNGQELLLVARDDGVISFAVQGGDYFAVTGATSYSTGQWITVGGAADGSDGTAYLDGSPDGSDPGNTYNLQSTNFGIGHDPAGLAGGTFFDGYVAEVIVCAGEETAQAFSDYHDDRLGS